MSSETNKKPEQLGLPFNQNADSGNQSHSPQADVLSLRKALAQKTNIYMAKERKSLINDLINHSKKLKW